MTDTKNDPHTELMDLADTYAIEDGLCLGSSKAEDARDALEAFARTLTDRLERAERMFGAACADLGAINEALGLDPDDGGAEPIIDAIQELQSCVGAGGVSQLTKPAPAVVGPQQIAEPARQFDAGYFYNSVMHALMDVDAQHGGCKYRLQEIAKELSALAFATPKEPS